MLSEGNVHLILPVSIERRPKGGILRSCQNVCDALSYLLDNVYIRFGTTLYRKIVDNPMGTTCAPLKAELF